MYNDWAQVIVHISSVGASGGGVRGPASRRKFCPPTRIDKVILQETTATMVLYTLPVVEPIIRVNDCQGYVPLTLDVMRVAFKVPLAFHTPL